MVFSMIVAKGETAALSTQMFIIWVVMGCLIYSSYGYRKNRKVEALATAENNKELSENEKIVANF